MLGIFALSVKWDPVSSSLSASIVTSEVTSNASGVNPASLKIRLKAMAKHPACAEASNSSGLVLLPSPKRELKQYCELFKTAFAVRFILSVFKLLVYYVLGGCIILHHSASENIPPSPCITLAP